MGEVPNYIQRIGKVLVVAPHIDNDKHAFKVANDIHKGEKFVVYAQQMCLPEEQQLGTDYASSSDYFKYILPEMRSMLIRKAENFDRVMVVMGSEIGTLYAAYYLLHAEIPVHLLLTNPSRWGGNSFWRQHQSLVINKLQTLALGLAKSVEVCGKEHVEMLPKAFPKVKMSVKLSDIPIPEGEQSGFQKAVPGSENAV